MTEETTTKPPLGPIPHRIWMQHRVEELYRAITEYRQSEEHEPRDSWVIEYEDLVMYLSTKFTPMLQPLNL